MKIKRSHGLLFLSLFFILSHTSCGGFQSVEKIKDIELAPEVPKDLDKRLSVETYKGNGKPTSKDVKKRSTKLKSIFTLPQAKARAKIFANTKAFRVGEKVKLSLTWFTIKRGEITLEVRPYVAIEGRKTYHFVGTAKSSSTMDLIHSVDDWVESYVDADTFYPIRAGLHGIETDRRREGQILFDYLNRKIHYWMKRIHVKKGTKEVHRADDYIPGILDVFSAAFYLRIQDLQVGKTYHSDLYNEGKHITVKADVLKRETIVTDIGDFNTLVIRPEAQFEGILKTSGDSLVWLSDDERHFIVRLETKIKIGYLRAEVISIEDPDYRMISSTPGKK